MDAQPACGYADPDTLDPLFSFPVHICDFGVTVWGYCPYQQKAVWRIWLVCGDAAPDTPSYIHPSMETQLQSLAASSQLLCRRTQSQHTRPRSAFVWTIPIRLGRLAYIMVSNQSQQSHVTVPPSASRSWDSCQATGLSLQPVQP
jgi:hypothetical protein